MQTATQYIPAAIFLAIVVALVWAGFRRTDRIRARAAAQMDAHLKAVNRNTEAVERINLFGATPQHLQGRAARAVTEAASGGITEDKTVGQVPFMITQTQREALRAKGFDDDQIANMTPEKAHQLLGGVPPLPYSK
jgi:hypothetical protein